jgi:hypothetical protein
MTNNSGSSQAGSSQARTPQAGSPQAGSPQNEPSATKLSQANYYERLGIRPNASVQDIRRAYRDLSKLYHPDTTQLESAIAIPTFQALNEAYATLSSPEKRLSYDYKIGFSRLSVMQSFGQNEAAPKASSPAAKPGSPTEPYSASAYINPSDRPLSAGEFFALFILGVTFIGCLLLVLTLSLAKGEIALGSPDLGELSQPELSPELAELIEPVSNLPPSPGLVPKSIALPTRTPAIPAQ